MFLHSFFIKYVICCSCHFRSLQHHIWKKYIYINAQSILGYVVTWRIQPVDPSNRVKEGCIFWPHLKEPLKWDNVDALLWRSQSSNAAFEGCDTWIETQPWCSLIYLKRTRELSAQTESPVFFFFFFFFFFLFFFFFSPIFFIPTLLQVLTQSTSFLVPSNQGRKGLNLK